ncbi:hypothetical protein DUNSADRAFT_17557 [Dunaliella salina]|uniref:Secreted protein n=1 Tax=Dunaliella salina TaxID=3046 RepID=A0ABQ7G1K4_DUNSA|nr:hypothetical protein DUNSADRAFT_17557 [Dunaliella salina]|eukprot:KAF5828480.1 hypothetical protein DUNSADRAFT_17557 [Dunaliella salina]
MRCSAVPALCCTCCTVMSSVMATGPESVPAGWFTHFSFLREPPLKNWELQAHSPHGARQDNMFAPCSGRLLLPRFCLHWVLRNWFKEGTLHATRRKQIESTWLSKLSWSVPALVWAIPVFPKLGWLQGF